MISRPKRVGSRGTRSHHEGRRSPRSTPSTIGTASVTGYCIKFKRLSAINVETLHAAIRHGMTFDQAV